MAPNSVVHAGEVAGVSTDTWQVFLGLAGLALVLLGGYIGLVQLRGIKRANDYTVLAAFNARHSNLNNAIKEIIDEMPILTQSTDFDSIAPAWAHRCRDLVGEINNWAQLIEVKLFKDQLFFSVFHSQVIRACYVLKPFIEWEEGRIGSRYGRRVLALYERARRYHSINPLHRGTRVLIARPEITFIAFDPILDPNYVKFTRMPRFLGRLRIRMGYY